MEAEGCRTEEKQLVGELIGGSEPAFTTLYYRYAYRLHVHLLRLSKSEEVSEEILQDVFMKVWEYREQLDPEKSFRSFLYKIAENKVYDYFRKKVRERQLADHVRSTATESDPDTDAGVCYQESLQLAQRAIDQLPPVRKRVFMLCKMEGKSYDEISTLMGVSTATVNDHMVKANRSLRNFLGKNKDTVLAWASWFLLSN